MTAQTPALPNAAAFAALLPELDQAEIERALKPLRVEQLRELVVELADHLRGADAPDLSPDGICATAMNAAAAVLGTTTEAILSADRHRHVTDARAVAMAAARRTGLTLPAIGAHFDRDHSVVMYAVTKVANNPRLDAACRQIVEQIDPLHATAADSNPWVGGRGSASLQRGALERPAPRGDTPSETVPTAGPGRRPPR